MTATPSPPAAPDEPDPLTQESARGALDELFLLARRYRGSSEYRSLLRFVADFRRYSAFNAMLVHVQLPGARFVLPARRWLEEYRCRPKEGAQPLVMLQPMGPVMFGFDVSQVEGPIPPEARQPLAVGGQLKESVYDRTVANARRDGVEVAYAPMAGRMGGYVRNAADPQHAIGLSVDQPRATIRVDALEVPCVAQVMLNSNHAREVNYATLVHELGHLYCGHVGTPDERAWPDRRGLAKGVREFEAESVSYLVCGRAGLDTPAAAYLHGYLDSRAETPPISLELVFRAVQRVERMGLKVLELPRHSRSPSTSGG